MKHWILVLGMLSLFVACKKKATRWDVELGAPLVNDTLDLNHLVQNQTLVPNGNGTLDLDFTKTILDIGLTDLVALPDTMVVQSFSPSLTLNVPPGFNVFNETNEHPIAIPHVQLKKIRVSGGKIQLKVFNPLPTDVIFDVFLPGVSANGIPFQASFSVAAGSQSNPTAGESELDLSGYEMDLRGINGTSFNTLQSQVLVKTNPLGPPVTVSPSNVFHVEASLKDIAMDYARGYFGQQVFSDIASVQVEALNHVLSGNVDVQNVQLNVSLSNGMKVPIKTKITQVQNTNSQGNTVNLNAPLIGQDTYLGPATGSWDALNPSTQQLTVTSSNSNVDNVLENLGSTLNLGYEVTINPNGNVNGGWDEIFSTSRLKVELHAQMPLQLQADQLTLVDTFALSLSQNNEKSHVTGGYFQVDVQNAFPLQSQLKLSFLSANQNIITEIIGDALILSSLAGTANANGLLVKKSSLQFPLNSLLMDKINDVKFVRVEAILDTPNPTGSLNQSVSIHVGAFIHVKIKAKLDTQIVY
jgi:hypothetical protein